MKRFFALLTILLLAFATSALALEIAVVDDSGNLPVVAQWGSMAVALASGLANTALGRRGFLGKLLAAIALNWRVEPISGGLKVSGKI